MANQLKKARKNHPPVKIPKNLLKVNHPKAEMITRKQARVNLKSEALRRGALKKTNNALSRLQVIAFGPRNLKASQISQATTQKRQMQNLIVANQMQSKSLGDKNQKKGRWQHQKHVKDAVRPKRQAWAA